MIVPPVTITPYKRSYRQSVRTMLFRSYRAHSHLDWHETDQWLESEGVMIRLAWSAGRLIGLLALAEPLNRTTWVRLAAVSDSVDAQAVLGMLWEALQDDLHAREVRLVALLVLRDWIVTYLAALGFHYNEDIVTLRRSRQQLPPPMSQELPIRVRLAGPTDLETVTWIDQAAFGPPWQLSHEEVRQAQRIAAISTVALLDDTIVGYQVSTLYFDGAHLARLAVAPEQQARGVGRVLVDDVLRRFHRRGVMTMTVNTQASNTRSQRLYMHFGFARNGYDLPVWMTEL